MAAVIQGRPTTQRDPREALTVALDRKTVAEATLEQSAAAVEQARAAVVAVQSHLAQFDDLDKRIAAARAEMVKRGDSGELPGGLVADREARRAGREKLDECNSALALLESQHAAAEKERRDAEVAHTEATLEVILDEASALSGQLLACHEMLWHRADSLAALDYVVMAAVAPLPPEVKRRLQGRLARLLLPLQTVHAQRQEPPAAAPNNPQRLQAAKWQALYAELKCDPKVQVRPVWEL